MTDSSDRFQLPLLSAAQAQKEITHNEALTLLDHLVQPIVQSVAPASIPASPTAGQSWIVGASPSGDWTGQGGKIACWTVGGWRFVAPVEGMSVWSVADSVTVRRVGSAWISGILTAQSVKIAGLQVVGPQRPAITSPSGGAIIDTEARTALSTILVSLRTHGLIAP